MVVLGKNTPAYRNGNYKSRQARPPLVKLAGACRSLAVLIDSGSASLGFYCSMLLAGDAEVTRPQTAQPVLQE